MMPSIVPTCFGGREPCSEVARWVKDKIVALEQRIAFLLKTQVMRIVPAAGIPLLAAAFLVPLLAQERATIRVEVRADSAPVADARVTINGVSLATDHNGIVIAPVTLGKVNVTVSKPGFLPVTASLSVDEARQWRLRIELQPMEPVKEEITVSATRTDRRIQDSPTRVEVLDRDEIEEKMLMTPGNIAMLLNEMGGLRVQTTSPSLGAASIRIQGMRGRYTRFLADGLPQFGQQGAGLGVLQIPPMDLDQVEVIKGVSSALYGAGAMAGIVNLISRRPKSEPMLEFLVNRSSRGATDVPLFLASPLTSRWSASLLAGGHWQERNDIDGDGWADLAGYSRGIVRPRVFWDGGEGRAAFLAGGFTYENRQGGTVAGSALPATGTPYIEALHTRRYDLGGSVQWLTENRFVVTTRFAVSSQRHAHRFGEILERDRHDLFFGELAVRGAFRRHTLVAGIAAEREAYHPRDVPRFAYRYTTPGVFFQDEVDVAPWLSLSAGARADFHNQHGTFLSPRLSALLRWKGWVSRLSAGLGFVAPTPLTEETEAAGLSRLVALVPLVAERGRSVSFDLTRNIGPASLTATFFASSVRHPIEVTAHERYEIFNLPNPITNAGVELLGTWRKAPFVALASYTYVRSRKVEMGSRVDVPLTPRHSLAMAVVWEKEATWRVGVESLYTGRQRLEHNPYRDESESYVEFGLMVERRVGPVAFFFNAENITDARQTRWNPLLRPNRGVDGRWTVDAWAPLEGRFLNGGIRLRF
jgi:iron complex outermembrane receptor protein